MYCCIISISPTKGCCRHRRKALLLQDIDGAFFSPQLVWPVFFFCCRSLFPTLCCPKRYIVALVLCVWLLRCTAVFCTPWPRLLSTAVCVLGCHHSHQPICCCCCRPHSNTPCGVPFVCWRHQPGFVTQGERRDGGSYRQPFSACSKF